MGERLIVLGVPRAGKTTRYPLAHHADEWGLSEGWAQAEQTIAEWVTLSGPWAWEGCVMARVLRRVLTIRTYGPPPCDRVVCLWTPLAPLSGPQLGLANAVRSVFEQVRPELLRRGVLIQTLS